MDNLHCEPPGADSELHVTRNGQRNALVVSVISAVRRRRVPSAKFQQPDAFSQYSPWLCDERNKLHLLLVALICGVVTLFRALDAAAMAEAGPSSPRKGKDALLDFDELLKRTVKDKRLSGTNVQKVSDLAIRSIKVSQDGRTFCLDPGADSQIRSFSTMSDL